MAAASRKVKTAVKQAATKKVVGRKVCPVQTAFDAQCRYCNETESKTKHTATFRKLQATLDGQGIDVHDYVKVVFELYNIRAGWAGRLDALVYIVASKQALTKYTQHRQAHPKPSDYVVDLDATQLYEIHKEMASLWIMQHLIPSQAEYWAQQADTILQQASLPFPDDAQFLDALQGACSCFAPTVDKIIGRMVVSYKRRNLYDKPMQLTQQFIIG